MYNGQVKNGKMHGYGEYKYKNGKTIKQYFYSGEENEKIKRYENWKNRKRKYARERKK